MAMRLEISRSALDKIRRESAAAAPREACGLLFGGAEGIRDAQATENISKNPETRFEIDPRALFVALRAERAGGPGVVGYWHSHPNGTAEPSPTDAAMAAGDGKFWLIVAGGQVTAWRALADGPVHGRFAPVSLECTD